MFLLGVVVLLLILRFDFISRYLVSLSLFLYLSLLGGVICWYHNLGDCHAEAARHRHALAGLVDTSVTLRSSDLAMNLSHSAQHLLCPNQELLQYCNTCCVCLNFGRKHWLAQQV